MSVRESPDRRATAIDASLEQRIRVQIAWEAAREGPPLGFPALPPLAAGRYTDAAFFALERDWLWRRCWLLAGREEAPTRSGASTTCTSRWTA